MLIMPAPFLISKQDNGKLSETSREIFREQFDALEPGQYFVQFKPHKPARFTATRYKWWFDCVLGLALPKVRQHFGMADRHGQITYPDTVEQLHHILKIVYNPVTIVTADGTGIRTVGQSTTGMPDKDFIGEFAEQIIADFSGAPYYAFPDTGCPDREEWADMYNTGEWHSFKQKK